MIAVIDGRGKDINWIKSKINRPSQMELKAEKRVVNEVLENVKVNGDKALIEYTAKFDGVLYDCAEEMMIKREDIEEAYQSVESRYISVIRKARGMI